VSRSRKKPVSPKVIALQNFLQRKRGVRDLHERFLIVCEDGKSAPNYFEALKKYENLSAASIAVFGSDGRTLPIQVVSKAIMRKKDAAKKDSGTEPFDQVWCMIDGDYGNKINDARSKANANDIKLAISTKCFEYWVLLHFVEADKPAEDCDGVVSILKKTYPKYSKGGCDFLDIVPHARLASARAKKLRKMEVLPEDQNPCSEVYKLIETILAAVKSEH
jgi:hypothetical protein